MENQTPQPNSDIEKKPNLTSLEQEMRRFLSAEEEVYFQPNLSGETSVSLPVGSVARPVARGMSGDVIRIETKSGSSFALKVPRAEAIDPKALEKEVNFLPRIQGKLEENGIHSSYLPKALFLPETGKPYLLKDQEEHPIPVQGANNSFSSAIVMEWLDQERTISGGFFRMKDSTPKSVRDRLPDGILIDINALSQQDGIDLLLMKLKSSERNGIVECNEFLRFSQAIKPVIAETFATLQAGILMTDRKAKDTVLLSENGEDRVVTLDWSDLEISYDPNANNTKEGHRRLGTLIRRLGNTREMLFTSTEWKGPAIDKVVGSIQDSLTKANRIDVFEDTVFFAKVMQLEMILSPHRFLSALPKEDMERVVANLSQEDQAELKEIESSLKVLGLSETLLNNPTDIPTGNQFLEGLSTIRYERIQDLVKKSTSLVDHLNKNDEYIALSDTVGAECDQYISLITDASFQGFMFDDNKSIKIDSVTTEDKEIFSINFLGLYNRLFDISDGWHTNVSAKSNSAKYEAVSAKIDQTISLFRNKASEYMMQQIASANKSSEISKITGYGDYELDSRERVRRLKVAFGSEWDKIDDASSRKYESLDKAEKNPAPQIEPTPLSSKEVIPDHTDMQIARMEYEGGAQQNAVLSQTESPTTATSQSQIDQSPEVTPIKGAPVLQLSDVYKPGMSISEFKAIVQNDPELLRQLKGESIIDTYGRVGVEYHMKAANTRVRDSEKVTTPMLDKKIESPAPRTEVAPTPPQTTETQPVEMNAWLKDVLERFSKAKGTSAASAILGELGIQNTLNQNALMSIDDFRKKVNSDPKLKTQIPPDQIDEIYTQLRSAFFNSKKA